MKHFICTPHIFHVPHVPKHMYQIKCEMKHFIRVCRNVFTCKMLHFTFYMYPTYKMSLSLSHVPNKCFISHFICTPHIFLHTCVCALTCIRVCRNVWRICAYVCHTHEWVMSHIHHTHSCTHVCTFTRVSICKNVCGVCVNEAPTHKWLIWYTFRDMWNEIFHKSYKRCTKWVISHGPTHTPANKCVRTQARVCVQECVWSRCVCSGCVCGGCVYVVAVCMRWQVCMQWLQLVGSIKL